MDYNGMSPEDAYYVRTGEPIQALADRIRTVAALRTPLTEKTAFELETLDNVPGADLDPMGYTGEAEAIIASRAHLSSSPLYPGTPGAICRETGRHDFPTLPKGEDGTDTCTRCGVVKTVSGCREHYTFPAGYTQEAREAMPPGGWMIPMGHTGEQPRRVAQLSPAQLDEALADEIDVHPDFSYLDAGDPREHLPSEIQWQCENPVLAQELEADPVGLQAARAVSSWELGYPDWADKLIRAYLNPELARRELAIERGDDD